MSDDTLNPKDIIGRQKLPTHLWPATATAYGALGFLEGMTKYGRVNYRATPVAASVYYAAALRHLADWFEGEEYTKEGGPHLGNALACIAIIVDAKVNGTLVDDRQFTPLPGAYSDMVKELTELAKKLVANVTPAVAPKHWDARDNKVEQQEVIDDGYASLAAKFNIVLPAGWTVYSCHHGRWIEFMVPAPIPGVAGAVFTQRHAKAHADVLRHANPGKVMRITWDDHAPLVLHVEFDPDKAIAQGGELV